MDAQGEIRFVYTAVDPRTDRSLAMTVIVEAPLPKSRTAHEWAEQWHRLSSLSFDGAYVATLTGLVLDVTRHADPNSIRLRTNEVALGATAHLPWELREFVREADAYGRMNLAPHLLRATPRDGMDGTGVLEAFLKEEESELKVGRVFDLPLSLQAGASSMGDRFVRWGRSAPITESARRTFSMGTCNGCHAGERDAADPLPFQHLAPSDLVTDDYASKPTRGTLSFLVFLTIQKAERMNSEGAKLLSHLFFPGRATREALLCRAGRRIPVLSLNDHVASHVERTLRSGARSPP